MLAQFPKSHQAIQHHANYKSALSQRGKHEQNSYLILIFIYSDTNYKINYVNVSKQTQLTKNIFNYEIKTCVSKILPF